jgi:hypothetical protein
MFEQIKRYLTFKFCVESVFEIGAGAEVDQLQVEGLQIDQQVLVLNVSVDDTLSVASQNSLDHLPEKNSGQLFLQDALLGDEVEEVLAVGGLLHHVDEGVVALVEVKQPDDTVDGLNLRQELELKRNSVSVHLKIEKK